MIRLQSAGKFILYQNHTNSFYPNSLIHSTLCPQHQALHQGVLIQSFHRFGLWPEEFHKLERRWTKTYLTAKQ